MKKKLKEDIIRSQHCQRNWDLSKQVLDEDIDLIVYAATNCPSKQNVSFYNLHVISNREIIEKIHLNTKGFSYEGRNMTNSQVLANLLLVFSYHDSDRQKMIQDKYGTTIESLSVDRLMAIGIASGYTNLISSILGYNTGYCACFDNEEIKKVLDIQDDIMLIIGIGFEDKTKDRKVHHIDDSFTYPAIPKEDIKVTYLK